MEAIMQLGLQAWITYRDCKSLENFFLSDIFLDLIPNTY